MNKHKKQVLPIALNLNQIIRNTIHNELRKFAKEHPESKFNIICWIDDECVDSVQEINDYLIENECPSRLKTGGCIIGKGRSTFDRLTKKEIL